MDPVQAEAPPVAAIMPSAAFQPSSLAGPASDVPPPILNIQGQQVNPDNTQLGYWTETEVAELKAAVESLCPPNGQPDSVDWLKVSALVPSRSAKQCRQKWLNHLRDGISKEPWSLQEEYVLARMHSKIGNKWQVLAKYLPRRPENTVKNHWSATTRAKGSARMRTLLWVYADLVVHKNSPHSPEVFNKACVIYSQLRGVPPISAFAVAEDHFISGPGKGLAGLDSGMAAPMGISSRVPVETRDRLRHQRTGDFEGEYMGDDGNMPMTDFPDFGTSSFPMFPGMDLLHPDLANAWLQVPGMPNFNFGQMQRQSMMMQPGFPNQMMMPQMQPGQMPIPAPRGWQGLGNGGGQYEGSEEQEEYDGSEPGDSQGDRRRSQRFRDEADEGAGRGNKPAAGGNDAANMLLALADAANSILDEDDGSRAAALAAAAPSRKRPYSEVSAHRTTSGDGGGNLNATPPPQQLVPRPDDPEKRALAQLAQEAAASLAEKQPGATSQDQLWNLLKQKMGRDAGTAATMEDVLPKSASEGGEERRVRATNSSSIATADQLPLNGVPRISSNGAAYPVEEGDAHGDIGANRSSPTSCTRGDIDVQDAAIGARSTPPLSSSAAAPGANSSSMEDSVVVTLGKLATDPSLSAQERVQLIGSYMKAVQSFVKISVD